MQKVILAIASVLALCLFSGENLFAQAAPPLTVLQITQVGSSQYQTNTGMFYENIGPTQSTASQHGGTEMRVITWEIGYGATRVARMAGAVLPSSAVIETRNVCIGPNGQYTINCTAGQTVVGFRRIWSLNGYQSGVFSYQNTSQNSPFNTISDSIFIQ